MGSLQPASAEPTRFVWLTGKQLIIGLCGLIGLASVLFPIWTVVPPDGDTYTEPPHWRAVIWHRPATPAGWSGRSSVDIQSTIDAVLLPAFRLFILFAVYGIASAIALTQRSPAWKAYGGAVLMAAVLALFARYTYGTHTEDADPLFGGGEVVEDFTATTQERNRHGWIAFVFVVVPAVVGTFVGRRREVVERRT